MYILIFCWALKTSYLHLPSQDENAELRDILDASRDNGHDASRDRHPSPVRVRQPSPVREREPSASRDPSYDNKFDPDELARRILGFLEDKLPRYSNSQPIRENLDLLPIIKVSNYCW